MIDSTGMETKAKLVDVSPAALTVDIAGNVQKLEEARVRQVQRFGDSLWNGMLIGMAFALPGTLIADPPYGPCESDPGRQCAKPRVARDLLGFATMGAIGAGVDAFIRGRHQVYLAPGQPLGTARRIQFRPHVSPVKASLAVIVR